MSFSPPIQSRIIKVMLERRRFMSTKKIAEMAQISWNTAEKYLSEYKQRGWVKHKKRGNRSYWKAIVRE